MGKDILSLRDFTKEEILFILEQSQKIKERGFSPLLAGKLMACCFFEPSTRTRLSFEAAMKRLGGECLGFVDGASTSLKKGESLLDMMRVIGSYADVIVMRHPLEGSARAAAEVTQAAVINAGDGSHEHPTQTFLDLFSMQECQGRLEGLSVACVGDLKYGRTVHSLALALKHFGGRLYFVSPSSLAMPADICDALRDCGVPFSCHESIEEVIRKVDILYMTRIQEERFVDKMEYEKVKGCFRLSEKLLSGAKEGLKIFHPLPRLTEIPPSIDKMPHAYYFEQAHNGLYVRAALLNLIFGVEL